MPTSRDNGREPPTEPGDLVSSSALKALAAFLPSAQLMKRSQSDRDAWVKMCYDTALVLAFDWPRWASTHEAKRLRDDPAAIPTATPIQLARLITVIIRQDRFVDGELQAAVEAGLVERILRRAADLTVSAPR